MQASYAGPLASYNSLTDEHLSQYFSNPRTFRHLRRMGLVTRDGRIVEEGIIRVNNARKEHKARSKGVMANSIANRAIEMERKRRSDLKRKLELLEKYEIVEKVKSQKRHPSGIQEFNAYRTVPPPPPRLSTTLDMHFEKLSLSSDQIPDMRYLVGKITRGRSIPNHCAKSPYEEDLTSRYSTPVPQPPSTPRPSTSASVSGRRSTIRSRPSTAPPGFRSRGSSLRPFHMRSQPMHSNVSITLKFIGTGLHLEGFAMETKLSEVMVVQQHCGGNTVQLYKGRVKPKDVFTFMSKRHIEMPYGITIYLDGMMDSRVSACCEYRHKCGRLLGSKTAHFKLVKVEGGKPCYRCEIERNKKYLQEIRDKEIDTVLGDTSSLQELETHQASANSDEEPPMIYDSPFHSGSESPQEEDVDNLQSPKADVLPHLTSTHQEVLSNVEDRTSLKSHSNASIKSRGSLKSLPSRVSVASSKSSLYSHISTVSKASSRSSKSTRQSLSVHKTSSRTSSNHSLKDKDSELSASKVSIDGSTQSREKDNEPKETAELEEEYNYTDEKFEELEEHDSNEPTDPKVENHSENIDPLLRKEVLRMSVSEPRESEAAEGDEYEEAIGEELEEVIPEDIHESNHQSDQAEESHPPEAERTPSPPMEEDVASEQASTPAPSDISENQQDESSQSESVDSGAIKDVEDNLNKAQQNDIQTDLGSGDDIQDESTSPLSNNDNTLDTADPENGVTEADNEDKPVQGSVQENNNETPTIEEPPVPEEEPAGDDNLPPSGNMKEIEVETKDDADDTPAEIQEEKMARQGILLTANKRKSTRLSVSFDKNDEQSSKDLSVSDTIEEAKKMLQKSQSNVSLGSLLNSEATSSVDLNGSDDEDIPELERRISDLIDDSSSGGKTESQEKADTTVTTVESREEKNVELFSQETVGESDDNRTNSQTSTTNETQEEEEATVEGATDRDSEDNAKHETENHLQEEGNHEQNTADLLNDSTVAESETKADKQEEVEYEIADLPTDLATADGEIEAGEQKREDHEQNITDLPNDSVAVEHKTEAQQRVNEPSTTDLPSDSATAEGETEADEHSRGDREPSTIDLPGDSVAAEVEAKVDNQGRDHETKSIDLPTDHDSVAASVRSSLSSSSKSSLTSISSQNSNS